VSRNFELMRRAGKEIGSGKSGQIVVRTEQNLATELAPVTPVFEDNQSSEWLRALGILQKHWKLSLLFASVVMVTTILVTVLTKPIYEATARVEVDPSGEKFSLENGGSGSSDAEYLETQAQVLQGDSLAIAVVRKLRLDQNPLLMDDPKAPSTGVTHTSDVVQLTPQESVALGNLKSNLKVKRDVASRLILVSFDSKDPELSAQVANTLVQTFIDQSFQSRHDAIMKSSEWLSRQLDDLRNKMEQSNQALSQMQ
jgi:succinoglycan biosynthesis transport protein ExoP